MEGIEHRTLEVNGISMHIAEKGQGPTVLLVHGFPELWYSWRHQIVGLAERGYRAVAPDLRGYGDTTAPPSVDSYTIFHLVGDLVALIDALGQKQEPGAAEAVLARLGTALVMRKVLTIRDPGPLIIPKRGWGSPDEKIELPSWLSEEDVSYFASKFEKSGFTGGINYYRCLGKNWELTAPWTGGQVKVPAKFVVGDLDLAYHFPGIQDYIHNGGFKRDVPLLEDVVVMEGVGHFINQERADEITQHIYDFIQKY